MKENKKFKSNILYNSLDAVGKMWLVFILVMAETRLIFPQKSSSN
jgi:hypothetical protein